MKQQISQIIHLMSIGTSNSNSINPEMLQNLMNNDKYIKTIEKNVILWYKIYYNKCKLKEKVIWKN